MDSKLRKSDGGRAGPIGILRVTVGYLWRGIGMLNATFGPDYPDPNVIQPSRQGFILEALLLLSRRRRLRMHHCSGIVSSAIPYRLMSRLPRLQSRWAAHDRY